MTVTISSVVVSGKEKELEHKAKMQEVPSSSLVAKGRPSGSAICFPIGHSR
jgi:hypothetical protein